MPVCIIFAFMSDFSKIKTIFLAFILYFFIINSCFAINNQQELDYLKYKLTSYIYSTTKTLKTSDRYLDNDLFCYLGSDNLIDFMEKNDLNQILLDVKSIRDFESVKKDNMLKVCSIVYVACNKMKTFKFLNNNFIDNNILTLSSCDSFVDNGGDIQIQVGRKSLELEINEYNFKLKQIKLNPSLIAIINNKQENIVYE